MKETKHQGLQDQEHGAETIVLEQDSFKDLQS